MMFNGNDIDYADYYSFFFCYRERPAAIPIEIKSIDDTSNFDEFPESDILQPGERGCLFIKENDDHILLLIILYCLTLPA